MKKFIKENYKGLLVGILAVVFQLCACALISIMNVKMAIGVLLTLICIMCILNLRKLLYIKLK